MEEDYQEFLDAFYPQPLEFFKKTEENRRERPLSNKEMSKMMTEHRSKSFTTYFPKDVFSKYCPSDVAVASSNYFSELAPRKSSSLLGCRNCCDSVLHPDHNKPCWFLKREITLHIFAWGISNKAFNEREYHLKSLVKALLDFLFRESGVYDYDTDVDYSLLKRVTREVIYDSDYIEKEHKFCYKGWMDI